MYSVADTIDLSGTSAIFLGTATKVILAGTIKPPTTNRLDLTGFDGGYLKVTAPLTVANGITSGLRVGLSQSDPGNVTYSGYVELTNTASNYTGGTTLQSGVLLVGGNSSGSVGSVTSGPLGTGTLTVSGSADNGFPVLVASAANVTLHNALSTPIAHLLIGVPVTSDTTSRFYPIQSATGNNLTLLGNITGGTPSTLIRGTGTVTLGGANVLGEIAVYDGGRLVASHNSALGGNNSTVYLFDGSDLQFTTLAPVIGSLSGGEMTEENGASYLTLTTGATLTINQTGETTFAGNIGGTPGSFSSTAAPPSVSASLVKTGAGELYLTGTSSYTGGTTINAGTIAVGFTANALGSGTVTLNGGTLESKDGAIINNPIAFGAGGGTLSGNSIFTSAITIGANAILSPGNSPGVLTFSSNLTFGPGGTYVVQIQDSGAGAGIGYDIVVVGGTLAFTSTIGNKFTFSLQSLDGSGNAGNLGVFNSSQPYTWVIGAAPTITGFNPTEFMIDATGFTNALGGGSFSLALGPGNTSLLLSFAPIPEPSTWAFFAGLSALALCALRRRR